MNESVDKELDARLSSEVPDLVYCRHNLPFPFHIPIGHIDGDATCRPLSDEQRLILAVIQRFAFASFFLDIDRSIVQFISRICSYTPMPEDFWPDFRVLVVTKSRYVAELIHQEYFAPGRESSTLLTSDSRYRNLRAQVIVSTVGSVWSVVGSAFDALFIVNADDVNVPPELLAPLDKRWGNIQLVKRCYCFFEIDSEPRSDRFYSQLLSSKMCVAGIDFPDFLHPRLNRFLGKGTRQAIHAAAANIATSDAFLCAPWNLKHLSVDRVRSLMPSSRIQWIGSRRIVTPDRQRKRR